MGAEIAKVRLQILVKKLNASLDLNVWLMTVAWQLVTVQDHVMQATWKSYVEVME